MSSLTRIVPWSQQLVCEVLQPGDLAVDLTTGKGRDTLALAEAVGPTGQVVAFDVQTEALDQSQRFLEERGQIVIRCSVDIELPEEDILEVAIVALQQVLATEKANLEQPAVDEGDEAPVPAR